MAKFLPYEGIYRFRGAETFSLLEVFQQSLLKRSQIRISIMNMGMGCRLYPPSQYARQLLEQDSRGH